MSTAQPYPLTVSAFAHLCPETRIEWRLTAVEDRASLTVEGPGPGYVTLFADRAELVRLRDAVTALVAELESERAALAQSLSAAGSAA